MREFVVRAYHLGDLERLAPETGDPASVVELMQAASRGARGWTLVEWDPVAKTGRGPLACAFVQEAGAGHWLLAAAVRKDVNVRAWAFATRHVREKLAMLSKYFGCKAVSATVRTNQAKAQAYLERFGFTLDEEFEPPAFGYLTMTRRTA